MPFGIAMVDYPFSRPALAACTVVMIALLATRTKPGRGRIRGPPVKVWQVSFCRPYGVLTGALLLNVPAIPNPARVPATATPPTMT